MHRYLLVAKRLEINSAEKDLAVLVDTKLTMSQKSTPLTRAAKSLLGCLVRVLPETQEGWSFLSVLSGKTTPGVWGPVLGSPVKGRYGLS